MGYWKSLLILSKIKKASGKFLRAWGKNQLRFEMFEKIVKSAYKNLNGKFIFTNFLSRLPGP